LAEIVYKAGRRTVEQIRAEVDAFFARLGSDPDLSERVERAGLDLKQVEQQRGEVRLSQEGEGIDLIVTPIVVAVGAHVGKSIWDDLLLPWIKHRLGQDALGSETERRD
jgi:hypothetical protein